MKLFGEKVNNSFTNSTYNILQVEDFSEIFFDVYEVKLNNGKFPVEKVAEYKGNPVVSVPIIVEGREYFYPFVLTKGKHNIVFHEKNTEIPIDDFIPEIITEEIQGERIQESKQEILEQIEQAKISAIKFAEKVKREKLQKANLEIQEKKKVLGKTLEKARENLVDEFVAISNNIKKELIGENDNRFEEIKQTIDNKINDLSDNLRESLINDFENSSKQIDENVKTLVKELYNSLQPKIDKELENIATEIVEKVDSIEKGLNEKLKDKADKTLIENVEGEIGSIAKANIELNDKINKGVNKALSRVGNIDKKVDDLTIALSEEVNTRVNQAEDHILNYYKEKIELLENQTFDLNEKTRKYFIELITESRDNLIDDVRKLKDEKPIQYIVESKGKKETINSDDLVKDFDKKINSKIDNEVTRLRKYIAVYSGGGSVAAQFADGGIMNGNLTVVGSISASEYLGLSIPSGEYLPLSGGTITGNLSVVGAITSVDSIQFDTTTDIAATAGLLTWDDADGTLSLGLKGSNVSLQLGQEEIIRVVNKTDTNLLESQYKVVRARTKPEGGAQGQRLAVVFAQANNKDNHTGILGIVTENINNNEEGFITSFGLVRNINTTGDLQEEDWDDGDVLWLSETVPGQLTNIEPTNHPVQIGYVVYSHQNQGKIFVSVDNSVDELGELHDVKVNNVQNNDTLVYNSLSSVWENKPVPNPDLSQYLNLSGGTINGNLTVTGTLSATLLEALSANITVLDIKQYELSGFNVTGNATVQGSISATGDLIVDTDTLYVNSLSGNVGIGTTNPTQKLTVIGNTLSDQYRLTDSDSYIGGSTEVRAWTKTGSTLTGMGMSNPQSVFFKPDGTKLYIIGSSADAFREWVVPTPWDLSSINVAVYSSFSVSSQDASPTDMAFASDGTKMFMIGINSDRVHQYTLNEAWALSGGATYNGSYLMSSQTTDPGGICFSKDTEDGKYMYIVSPIGDAVYQYELTNPYVVTGTGAVTYLQSFSVASREVTPTGIDFNSDGTRMYIIGQAGDDINEYRLSTPWDISTAAYFSTGFTDILETAPTGLYIADSVNKAYYIGITLDRVIELDTSPQVKVYSDSLITDGQFYAGSNSEFGGTVYINGELRNLGAATFSTTVGVGGTFTNNGAATLGNTGSSVTIQLGGTTTLGNTKLLRLGSIGNVGSITNIDIGTPHLGTLNSYTPTNNLYGSYTVNGPLAVDGKYYGRFNVSETANGTTLFYDTFTETSDTLLDAHTPDIGSGWTRIQNDSATASVTVYGNQGSAYPTQTLNDVGVIYLANETISDRFEIECDLSQISSNASANGTFIFKYLDNDNFYALRYSRSTGNTEVWRKSGAGGTATQIGGDLASPSTGASNIKIRCIDGFIIIIYDNEIKYVVRDGIYSALGDRHGIGFGDIGIYTNDDMSTTASNRIDTFKITPYADSDGSTTTFINTNVGIGTTSPISKLTIENGDIETTTIGNGVILKSPNGTRWRVTVDDTGALTSTAL